MKLLVAEHLIECALFNNPQNSHEEQKKECFFITIFLSFTAPVRVLSTLH